ncbi:MAG TPA: class I SAM-dependent methyltransferase [Solirubrobacteraceae bacterium]|jgi:2-polyprenyl-3-methyl-5-hydroxy-6-metoxy-1,4-benzoquinol methylase
MSAGQVPAISGIPTGNTFDKYGSSNRVVRRLMAGFERAAGELIDRAAPSSILDVGCGEGVLTYKWADRLGDTEVVGLDLPDPKLEAEWRLRTHPNVRFVAGHAERLPFAEDEFELVTAIETLEHIADPDRALSELARVARRHLLVSVPREPLWRGLNVARGAHVSRLGNTPGHVNHWSRRGLERLLAAHGELVEVRTPFPWTMALVYVC